MLKENWIIVRIASSAMILHSSHPEQGVFIAENAMQSVGLSPILFEVNLVLLRWYTLEQKALLYRKVID